MREKIIFFLIWIVILTFSVQASQFLPQRCNFGPQLICEEFSVNQQTSELFFTVRNSIATADFRFEAFLRKESDIPAIHCRCEEVNSCRIEELGVANVKCTFTKDLLKNSDSTKFKIIANITSIERGQIAIEGEVYYRPLKRTFIEKNTPLFYILSFIILILLYTTYAILLKKIIKSEQIKKWFKSALKSFLILMILLPIFIALFMIFSAFSISDTALYPLRDLVIIPQISAFCISLPIAGITAFISYLINRKNT